MSFMEKADIYFVCKKMIDLKSFVQKKEKLRGNVQKLTLPSQELVFAMFAANMDKSNTLYPFDLEASLIFLFWSYSSSEIFVQFMKSQEGEGRGESWQICIVVDFNALNDEKDLESLPKLQMCNF